MRLAVRRCATLWTGKKPVVEVMLVEASAMKWTSVLAIYFLIFCFTAFLLLPFGVKTHEEAGAETHPRPGRQRAAQVRPAEASVACGADRVRC